MGDSEVVETTRNMARDYIARIHKELTKDTAAKRSSAALDYQRRRLTKEFETYMEAQTSIIAACVEATQKGKEMEEVANVDTMCSALSVMIGEILEKNQSASLLDQTLQVAQAGNQRSHRLPDNLSVFDGTHANWPAFRDLFKALVDDKEFSDLEKLLCLQKHCVGTAAGIVAGYQPVAASYDQAWKDLTDAFEDKYAISQSFVDRILDIPAAKHTGIAELRRVVDTTRSTLRQLTALGGTTDPWDAMMSNLLARKLPARIVIEWDQKRERASCPSFEELIQFVESKARSRVFQAEQMVKPTMTSGAPAVAKETTTGKGSFFRTKTTGGCFKCNGDHRIIECPQFLAITDVKEREQAITNRGLCVSCLSFGHKGQPCPRFPCKEKGCNGVKHHPVLCPVQASTAMKRPQAHVNMVRRKKAKNSARSQGQVESPVAKNES